VAYSFIYITCSNKEDALDIANQLLEEKLIACANILPDMTSVFSWKGELEESLESVLILKTKDSLYQQVEARVKELHKFECPCIVSLPIQKGFAPYLKWIDESTK